MKHGRASRELSKWLGVHVLQIISLDWFLHIQYTYLDLNIQIKWIKDSLWIKPHLCIRFDIQAMLESLFRKMMVLNQILCLFVSLYDGYYLSTYKFTLLSLQPTYMIAKHLLPWNGRKVSYFSFTTWVELCCFVFSFHLFLLENG